MKNTTVDGQGRGRSAGGRPLRVLLTDDDLALRAMLAQTLRRAGHEVEETVGAGVLDQLGRTRVDVVVGDVGMPGMTSLEALESIRATTWRVPVVLCSKHGDPDVTDRAHQLGALVLQKPVDPSALCFALRRIAATAVPR